MGYFKIYFKPGIPDFFLTIPVRYFSDWDSASANLIFAGLYLHHAAEQVIRLDSLEKRAVKKKKMQLNVWIRASLKFSGWLSVDLISNSDFLVLLGTEKKKGPSKRWSALLSTRFYKRLHQRPNTLYFRVEPGLAMIIPDMNSSTTISKLNLPLLSISAFFPIIRLYPNKMLSKKALAFIFSNNTGCSNKFGIC